jgi:hypothetical protein
MKLVSKGHLCIDGTIYVSQKDTLEVRVEKVRQNSGSTPILMNYGEGIMRSL